MQRFVIQSKMPIISVDHVSKEFQLGQLGNLRHSTTRFLSRMRGKAAPVKARFKALDDISFTLESSEVLGIVGTNGAGKSTLLKLLCRITVPSAGQISVRGKIAPLIEVGAGLIGDLSGRENIFLNGIILGMPYAEIRKKLDEIVAFAELEEFIDTPIKRYSSGMAMRLGFSIATCVDADILIVDEVLAVGDLAFQRKCFDRMEDMIKRQGKTVLLVSHNIRQVERLCSRVMLLDHGRIVDDGEPSRVCERFYERSDAKIKAFGEAKNTGQWANAVTSDSIEVTAIDLIGSSFEPTEVLTYKEEVEVRVRFVVRSELKLPVIGVGFHTPDLLYITTHESEPQLKFERLLPGRYEAVCRIRDFPLLPGVYALRMGVSEGIARHTIFYGENLVHFQVVPRPGTENVNRFGFFELDADWRATSLERPSERIDLAHLQIDTSAS